MSLLVEVPSGYEAERAWIAEVMLGRFLGLSHRLRAGDRDDVRITLEGDAGAGALRMPDVLFATPPGRWLTEASLPSEPLPEWDVTAELPEARVSNEPLPVIFAPRRGGGPWLRRLGAETLLDADLLGSAFFLLSRYEEVPPGPRDVHGRFPAGASIAARGSFLERPVVNEYLDALWALLARLWPGLRRPRRRFRVRLTHDVDLPFVVAGSPLAMVARHAGGDLLKRRDLSLAVNRLRAFRDGRRGRFDRDPADTFDFLLDSSERHGLESAFYFICGRTNGDMDGTYTLHDPRIRTLVRDIHARGHEIGLHPSYGTYREPAAMRREFEALQAVAEREGVTQDRWGARQHYLRWENPTTWQGYADAGLDYDSTLGFADRPGFRCGVCYPYPTFNLATRTALPLMERPLHAMETSLLLYMGLSLEESLARIVEIARAVRRHEGEFVLLWHNSTLLSSRQKRVYSRLIGALAA